MVQRFCVEAFDSVGDRSPSHTELVGSSAEADRRAEELGFRHAEVRVIDLSVDEPPPSPKAAPSSPFDDRFLRVQ